jgi:5-methyltetrahydrofolate--homocysteine methyltransferase
MAIIVGERINTVSNRVQAALERRDGRFFRQLAISQARNGAGVIDINVGCHPDLEPEAMRWAVGAVQEVVDLPLAIDSPNPETIVAGLFTCREPKRCWANSITFERARIYKVMPAVVEAGCNLVALCLDERGIPPTASKRLDIGRRIVLELERYRFPPERLFLDVLVEPISIKPEAALISLETISAIKAELPQVNTIISLSAISFGLPHRRLINRSLLPLLVQAGIDAIILDPLDAELMATLKATEAVLGRDASGLEFISSCREGLLTKSPDEETL